MQWDAVVISVWKVMQLRAACVVQQSKLKNFELQTAVKKSSAAYKPWDIEIFRYD